MAFFALEWLAIYGGLRAVRGLSHYAYWQAGRNFSDLGIPLPADSYDPYYRLYAWFGAILFGPMLYLAIAGAGSRANIRGKTAIAAANTTVKRTSVIRSLLRRRLVLCTLPPRLANNNDF